jgi:hypothetical protein
VSSRTCPDWPELMELAPELQFKHFTVRELGLSADALMALGEVNPDEVSVCADPDKHVYYAPHTDPQVVEGLKQSHWFDLDEWRTSGPGSARSF